MTAARSSRDLLQSRRVVWAAPRPLSEEATQRRMATQHAVRCIVQDGGDQRALQHRVGRVEREQTVGVARRRTLTPGGMDAFAIIQEAAIELI